VAKITIAFAILLILLGIIGFVATGSSHPTALIPTWAGLAFALLGFLALKDNLRKHAMHFAALLAVIGFAATAKGVVGVGKMAFGESVERPAAAISQAIMSLLCVAYVALCVRSFLDARRKRRELTVT
jgi:fucose 4-O-acetylase-like acetyltransferase